MNFFNENDIHNLSNAIDAYLSIVMYEHMLREERLVAIEQLGRPFTEEEIRPYVQRSTYWRDAYKRILVIIMQKAAAELQFEHEIDLEGNT